MAPRTKIFFDGGCRPAGLDIAVVLRGETYLRHDPVPGDSMAAEWRALIAAVRLARQVGLADVVFLGDSRVVIGQAIGAVRARDHALPYLATFRELTGGGQPPPVRYVKRSQNLAGIALDRRLRAVARDPASRVLPG